MTQRARILAFASILLMLGCDKTVEPTGDGRIVFFEGIDGVRFGQDTATVVQRLGRPNVIEPLDSISITLRYTTGSHAGLTLSYYLTPGLQGQGITTMLVQAPYSGQTSKGIGIQSLRNDVVVRHGAPAIATEISDTWTLNDSIATVIFYDGDRVELIATHVMNHD
jgi:hypothetical protein